MEQAALESLLKTQPGVWRGRERYTNTVGISTGFAALDDALPARGWGIGGVTEILLEQQGIGELSLLLPALREVASWSALVNPPHIAYAPAFNNAGIALDKLLIVNTDNDINTLWATEQILRSGLFGAVISWVTKSSAQRQRRLQLAAEAGNSWATVYRPLSASQEHSPVATRICLSMNPQQHLTLDIIKVRAGNPQTVTIEPEEFDAPQGSEWPASRSLPALDGIALRGIK